MLRPNPTAQMVFLALVIAPSAFGAPPAQDDASSLLRAAAERLSKWDPAAGETLPEVLSATVKALTAVPPVHTASYTEQVADPSQRARLKADAVSLEELLRGLADRTLELLKASDADLPRCLQAIDTLKKRIAEPSAYGNRLAEMALGEYVAKVGLLRMLNKPAAAGLLEPVLQENLGVPGDQWRKLAVALAEETAGKLHLSDTDDVLSGLKELLHYPVEGAPEISSEAIERDGPAGAASIALLESRLAGWTRLPKNMEKVYPPGLVALFAMSQDSEYAAVWWSAFLKKHPAVPHTFAQMQELFAQDDLGAKSVQCLSTGKPFGATELASYSQGRHISVYYAILNFLPNPAADLLTKLRAADPPPRRKPGTLPTFPG